MVKFLEDVFPVSSWRWRASFFINVRSAQRKINERKKRSQGHKKYIGIIIEL